jgi:predicted phage tail protein
VNLEIEDAQPPAAPSNLAITATSANTISLSWTDNATTETGFKLERCQNNNCTNFQQLPAFGANTTTYTDTGLKANATYRYRIRAFNAAGNSAYSNIVSGRARK